MLIAKQYSTKVENNFIAALSFADCLSVILLLL